MHYLIFIITYRLLQISQKLKQQNTPCQCRQESSNGVTPEAQTGKPQNAAIASAGTSTTSLASLDASDVSCSNERRRSIQFGHVLIRTHSQALGDNPSVSRGPPLTLDWPYNEADPIAVDEYEEWANDKRRRSRTEILVPHTVRRQVLFSYGYSVSEINAGIKRVNQAKKQRRASLDTSSSLMGNLKTKMARRNSW